jgi:hypothetical protein
LLSQNRGDIHFADSEVECSLVIENALKEWRLPECKFEGKGYLTLAKGIIRLRSWRHKYQFTLYSIYG